MDKLMGTHVIDAPDAIDEKDLIMYEVEFSIDHRSYRTILDEIVIASMVGYGVVGFRERIPTGISFEGNGYMITVLEQVGKQY